MMLIDTHCHFDFFDKTQQAILWKRMVSNGIKTMVVPSVMRATWDNITDLCRDFSIYAAYGLHPLYLEYHQKDDIALLETKITDSPCVAIGECGLDFSQNISRTLQQFYFEQQIHLAIRQNLPLILHARNALEAVLQTLQHYPGVRFVIHSFTGSDRQLDKLLNMGGYIGVGGACTYPRAQRLRRQLSSIPGNCYFLETDAPSQPLYGYQGQLNEPARLINIVQVLSQLRDVEPHTIVQESTANAQNFFQFA